MIKNTKISTAIAIIFLLNPQIAAENLKKMREKELQGLKTAVAEAKRRIRETDNYRGRDWLRMLPTVTVTRREPYGDMPSSETYIGASISINKLFDITDVGKKREAEKRKALMRIKSLEFKIRKLIEWKYLIKWQIWKFRQIKRSMDNPIKIARFDEKIDILKLKHNEISMGIEEAYAEIEYVCVEVEK